jgi:hypothetical protein
MDTNESRVPRDKEDVVQLRLTQKLEWERLVL